MRRYQVAVLALAIVAVALLAVSGPATRQGWVDWRVGLWIYRIAAWLGMAAAVLALGGIVALAVPRLRMRPWMPVVALCIALVAVAPPLIFQGRAESVPPIHDITTDFTDPPGFVALLPVREASPNKAAYGGEAIAAQQRQAYGDIAPLKVALPPRDAMQKALDAARSLGWEVVASDTAAGRIEATDTTGWFGFKDDVVVRIRPDGDGSRVDVRSVSRVGSSDVGANAARIRQFLAKLA